MSSKLCPKVLLEGTRLTLKTEIAFGLNEHPRIVSPRRYRCHAPLISAEWCAFTNFPWGRGLINFEPQEEGQAMEAYSTWVRLFELLPYYSWIADRFHPSTRAYQLTRYGKDDDFRRLEERLARLGFHLVLCTRAEASFAAAREQRIPVSGKPEQYDDLSVFMREQELLRRLARDSLLPKLELAVSDNNVVAACEQIADWMSGTGGLWAKT